MFKSILVTGGAGFIGSNFVSYFARKYPEYLVVNLDKLTYAGSLVNLRDCDGLPNYKFVRGDICDRELVDGIFRELDVRGVIHFAAESHVDNSIKNPRDTYGLNVTTSNCSNNYGPRQHSEKFIPTIIRKCLREEDIPVYGKGENVRDWLYVLDHCKAIDLIYHTGKSGETYNVGGHNERNNLMIAKTICGILDEKRPRGNGQKYAGLISFVQDRAGHDFRYAIDANKLETELGWRVEETFDTGISKTVEWYLNDV